MTVLVAYNGMHMTEKALKYSINYAKTFGERLYIISVIDTDRVSDTDAELIKVKKYMSAAEKLAKAAGVDIHIAIETGSAGETIMAAAERFKSDTIVVGRSNKSSMDRAVLGSVSNYVLNHARCTVIVVH